MTYNVFGGTLNLAQLQLCKLLFNAQKIQNSALIINVIIPKCFAENMIGIKSLCWKKTAHQILLQYNGAFVLISKTVFRNCNILYP